MCLFAAFFTYWITVSAAVSDFATSVDRLDDSFITQIRDVGSGDGSGFPDIFLLEGSGEIPQKPNKNFTVKTRTVVKPRMSLERYKPESNTDEMNSSGLVETSHDMGSHLPVIQSTTAPDRHVTQRTTKSDEAIIFDELVFTFDEEEEQEGQTLKVNPFNNCLSNCPQGGFVLTTSPARLTTEETNSTVHLKCEAQFKKEASNELQVTFEWLYRMHGGKPCSLGPSPNHDRCDSRLFKFSTDESTQGNGFVSNLNLSALTKNHSGILDCIFTANCCSFNNGQSVEPTKIEAMSELVVYARPDYTVSLSLSAAITAILCLILTFAIFLYFRFEHKVEPSVSWLEKNVLKRTQMQLATPPVLADVNFCFIAEENRVSDTSFDSTADPGEAEA